MGSVLRSFGAFQGNIWSVAPFIPVGSGENDKKKREKSLFLKKPSVPDLYVNVSINNRTFQKDPLKQFVCFFLLQKNLLQAPCGTYIVGRSYISLPTGGSKGLFLTPGDSQMTWVWVKRNYMSIE